jgi:hypothetical protein
MDKFNSGNWLKRFNIGSTESYSDPVRQARLNMKPRKLDTGTINTFIEKIRTEFNYLFKEYGFSNNVEVYPDFPFGFDVILSSQKCKIRFSLDEGNGYYFDKSVYTSFGPLEAPNYRFPLFLYPWISLVSITHYIDKKNGMKPNDWGYPKWDVKSTYEKMAGEQLIFLSTIVKPYCKEVIQLFNDNYNETINRIDKLDAETYDKLVESDEFPFGVAQIKHSIEGYSANRYYSKRVKPFYESILKSLNFLFKNYGFSICREKYWGSFLGGFTLILESKDVKLKIDLDARDDLVFVSIGSKSNKDYYSEKDTWYRWEEVTGNKVVSSVGPIDKQVILFTQSIKKNVDNVIQLARDGKIKS